MTRDYFYSLTYREFINTLRGARKVKEAEIREGWERTRIIIVNSLLPHLKKGSSSDPTKIYPLPWDREPLPGQEKGTPEEELKKSLALWERIDKGS